MRWVMHEEGKVEVRWIWLPTFIGQNIALMKRLDTALGKYLGHRADDALLDEMNAFVVDFLCMEYPMPGLRKYLEALKHVE